MNIRRGGTGLHLAAMLVVFFSMTALFSSMGRADSIYRNSAGRSTSLYSTTKGEYKIGDIITILIVESIKATNTTDTSTDKETELEMGFQGFEDLFGMEHVFSQPLVANPQFRIDGSNEFDGGGSSRRSSAITGTISGEITEILPNGNLQIEASQSLVINGEKNSVIIVGTIRPEDISAQNSVLSTQIAAAEIKYAGK